MFKNYLKTIIRNIKRNKGFTAINVIGLSLGLASFIAITEYVRFETSYDSYNPNAEDIIRLGLETNLGGSEIAVPFWGAPVAQTIKADFPEVVDATRLYPWIRREYYVKYKDMEIKEPSMTRMFADGNFFDFFNIRLLEGDKDRALSEPNLVVITETMAAKYFGQDWRKKPVIGEFIEVQEIDDPLKITGISEDVPDNTHYTYNFLISMTTLGAEASDTHWLSNAFYHYFQLRPDADADEFVSKLVDKRSTYLASDMRDFLGTTYEEYFAQKGTYFDFFYQPLKSIHLNSHYELELAENGDKTYVKIFTGVSLLVLLMAAINFMNLSSVAGLKRHKEVGIRKVLGSLRGQLIFQFLFESVLIVCVSLFLGITTIQVTAPIINELVGMQIIPPLVEMLTTVGWLFLGAIGLGMLSGLYPSIALASCSPGAALKGGIKRSGKSSLFRNGLIIFQFSISLLLIIGVAGIKSQIELMRNHDLGYAKDQVLIIDDVEQVGKNNLTLRDRLKNESIIESASLSGFVPIGSNEYGMSGYDALNDENDQTLRIKSAFVDEYYLNTYNIELVAGRNFNSISFNDSSSIIVNRRFLEVWGWPIDEVIGKQVENIGLRKPLTVIGVVENFQHGSMKDKIEPFIFEFSNPQEAVSVRFLGENWGDVVQRAETIWSEFTDKPFSYTFASNLFDSVIKSEENAGRLFSFFSGLAIFIGALGLLGVASFVIIQRSKEVGIRKVLGASLPQLFLTLSKSFVLLIVISGIVAIPISYYLLQSWLNQYVYKIGMSGMLFLLPFLAIMFVSLLIVGTQVLKVALVNPIKSLRYE